MLLGNAFKLPGVVDGGVDLPFVPDDTCVIAESRDILCPIGCHLGYVESVECFPEVRPLVAHKLPAEACLEYAPCQVLKVLDICFRSFILVHPVWGSPIFRHTLMIGGDLLEVLRSRYL